MNAITDKDIQTTTTLSISNPEKNKIRHFGKK